MKRRLDGHFRPVGHAPGGHTEGTSNRLYKNNRDGTFTDVTEKAGLHRLLGVRRLRRRLYNDGFDDIFCTRLGQNILYRNTRCTFTDVTKAAVFGP